MVPKIEGSNRYDTVIIGAGPAGSYASLRLSKFGHKVLLIDMKHEIGRPMHCAGLVNNKLFKLPFLDRIEDQVLLGEISGADVFSPNGTIVPLRGRETKAYSIDRYLFDSELLKMAANSGTRVLLGTRLKDIRINKNGCSEISFKGPQGKGRVNAGMVLGCDGGASETRSIMGLENPKETIPGISMEIEIGSGTVPRDRVAVLTGEKTARGFFAWIIPSFPNNGIRIGLSSVDGPGLRAGLKNLFEDKRVSSFLSTDGKESLGIISKVYGSVPMGQPREISKGPVLLMGDSAGMAKPTSGGGIFPALMAVDTLVKSIDAGNGTARESIRTFNEKWKKGYGRELTKAMALRRIVRDLSDEEINAALIALSDEKKLDLINEKGDIDQPVQLAVGLLRMDPSLLALIPRFIPHLRRIFF